MSHDMVDNICRHYIADEQARMDSDRRERQAALERDARRYRWLRAADCPSAQVIIDLAHDHSILADSEALDQHIDRAMGGGA